MMLRFGTPSASARKAINAAFAAPSTGGAARRTRSAPASVTPSSAVRPARGTTRIANRAAPSAPMRFSRSLPVNQVKLTGSETISASYPSGVAMNASQLPLRFDVRATSVMSRSSPSCGFQSGQMKA